MVEWVLQKVIGVVYKQVVLAPVRVGRLLRKNVEYKKLYVPEVTRKANLSIAGIVGGIILLAGILFLCLDAVLALGIMVVLVGLSIMGYWDVEIDSDLKRAQEWRAEQYKLEQANPLNGVQKSGEQTRRLIALSLVVGGLVLCGVGVVVFLTTQGTPSIGSVQGFHPFSGWGLSDWLIKVLVPILIFGGVLLLIFKRDASLLKFAAVFIVFLIAMIGVGRGVSGAWNWVASTFSGTSATPATPTGFVQYSPNKQPTPAVKRPEAKPASSANTATPLPSTNPTRETVPSVVNEPTYPPVNLPSAPRLWSLSGRFVGGYIVSLQKGVWSKTGIVIGPNRTMVFNFNPSGSMPRNVFPQGRVEVSVGGQRWESHMIGDTSRHYSVGGSSYGFSGPMRLEAQNDLAVVSLRAIDDNAELRVELWSR